MLTFVIFNEMAEDHSIVYPNTEVIPVASEDSPMPVQPAYSPSSESSLQTLEGDPICRICLDRGTEPLVSPCKCAGSAKFAHESCLLQWFFKTRRRRCELCLSEVNVKSVGFKPLQKWRLPTDSCDFVFYLFTLYCVIMFVFTGMIIWIATQGCLSPVCITLYVICSMSLVYFIYCCGCVEYSKTYWKACVTTNKNWRIYNREESARTKMKASRVTSIGSESVTSKKSDHCEVSISQDHPIGPSYCGTLERGSVVAGERSLSHAHSTEKRLTGSPTLVHSYQQAEDTRRIEVMSPQIVSPTCSSSSSSSPVSFGRELAHSGSISLLMELNCYSQHEIWKTAINCKAHRSELRKNYAKCRNDYDDDDDGGGNCGGGDDDHDHDDHDHDDHDDNGDMKAGRTESTLAAATTFEDKKVMEYKVKGEGLTNKGFDDTKL